MSERVDSAQSSSDPGLVVMWHFFATEDRADGWTCVWIGDDADLEHAKRELDQERPAMEPGEAVIFALSELQGRTFGRRARP